MQVFITKWALSYGIFEIDADLHSNKGMVSFRRSPEHFEEYCHHEGKDWHLTREGAVNRAEEMRIAKLKSLDKQTKKISAMKFKII